MDCRLDDFEGCKDEDDEGRKMSLQANPLVIQLEENYGKTHLEKLSYNYSPDSQKTRASDFNYQTTPKGVNWLTIAYKFSKSCYQDRYPYVNLTVTNLLNCYVNKFCYVIS
jgi:hypothetical protein